MRLESLHQDKRASVASHWLCVLIQYRSHSELPLLLCSFPGTLSVSFNMVASSECSRSREPDSLLKEQYSYPIMTKE
jgi:hypothetical protein